MLSFPPSTHIYWAPILCYQERIRFQEYGQHAVAMKSAQALSLPWLKSKALPYLKSRGENVKKTIAIKMVIIKIKGILGTMATLTNLA